MVGFCYLFMRFLLKIWLNGGVTKYVFTIS